MKATNQPDPASTALLKDLRTDDPMERQRELLRRVNVLRSGMGNVGALAGKSPEMSYAWVFNDRQVIDYYAAFGYEVVTNGNDPELQSAFRKEDGRHVRGDAILLRVHQEIVEALNLDRELRALNRQDSAREEFTDWGANSGVPIERRPHHGRN